MKYQSLPCDASVLNPPVTGVLLVNLGTPDAPDASSLRRYLAEFLSDPRVIELPRWLWKIILYGIVLRTRPAKSAKAYQSVWTNEGSPLLQISKNQLKDIRSALGDSIPVALGMRYGNPSIASALQELQQQRVDRIVVLPLYPQYSGPTTGSVFDAVTEELRRWRYVPELHFIHNYGLETDFIDLLARSIGESLQARKAPQKLLFSYHGTPQGYADAGDPYYQLCVRTTRLVEKQLGLEEGTCITTFQSRFGNEEWLKPYTDETLQDLPAQDIKHVAIVSPAFSADCLETLEELAVENRDLFMKSGGETYHYIPALNDKPEHINFLVNLIRPYLPSADSQ